MKKQQIILVAGGTALLLILFLWGKTRPEPKNAAAQGTAHTADDGHDHSADFNIQAYLSSATAALSAPRQAYLTALQSAVVRGDVKNQQIHVYHQLAAFWRDSVPSGIIYSYYAGEASKLENSQKSLTFAARLFLDNLRGVEEPGIKSWMAGQGIELFEKILVIDPANDSAKIGLGSCYIFSNPSGDPQQVMQGIQKILEVARRDSSNMYAQLMLGVGGVVSGQYDKAIERLLTVVNHQPDNLEAILTLAEAYERQGDKQNAIKWYKTGKSFLSNPEVLKVIDQRIKSLE